MLDYDYDNITSVDSTIASYLDSRRTVAVFYFDFDVNSPGASTTSLRVDEATSVVIELKILQVLMDLIVISDSLVNVRRNIGLPIRFSSTDIAKRWMSFIRTSADLPIV